MLAVNKLQTEVECCDEEVVHTGAVCHARKHMPNEEITLAASDFFKAFSDKTRLRILAALALEELCVCDIASLLGMSQSAISHQLPVSQAGSSGEEPKRWQNGVLCAV